MKPPATKIKIGRIKGKSFKIIGVGGIGSILVLFLSQFLASLKHKVKIYLIDGDTFELRNKERMLFEQLTNKAVAKASELARHFGHTVQFYPIPEYISPRNIRKLIKANDTVFLCVDNHATRRLVSEHCAKLRNVFLISGGNDGVENGKDGTFGNVQIYVRRNGRDVTNSLTRFHAEIAHPADQIPNELSCAELAQTSAPQLLFTNLSVASAMLNVFYAYLRDQIDYEAIYLDITKSKSVPVKRETANNQSALRGRLRAFGKRK